MKKLNLKARCNRLFNFYFNPKASWDIKFTQKNIQPIIKELQECIKSVTRSALREYVGQMPYKAYLNTPYWKFMAYYTKQRKKFRCQVCGKQTDLNVHHLTYDHLGYEILHKGDLKCYCQSCHKAEHDKV
jgi:5-methylcytosine-specific restriction endonuclease McrA